MTWTAQSAAYKKHKKDKRRSFQLKSGQPILQTKEPCQSVHLHEKKKGSIDLIIIRFDSY